MSALGSGPGRSDFIAWALTANPELQARFMAGSVAILARHHQAVPITRIRVAGTVLGETAEGAVVVPAPVDYVSWTERVANFAGRPDLVAAKARRVWQAGKLSPRARHELTARKWTIEEGSPSSRQPPPGPRGARDALGCGIEPYRLQDGAAGAGFLGRTLPVGRGAGAGACRAPPLATRDFVGQIVGFSTVLPDYNERGMSETGGEHGERRVSPGCPAYDFPTIS